MRFMFQMLDHRGRQEEDSEQICHMRACMPHESLTGLTRAADPFDFSALLIVVRALNDGACFQQAARHHAVLCTSISSPLLSRPACAGCHGPNGAGIPAQYARVAGQHQDYTIAQLTNFRTGTRANSAQMTAVGKRMSDEEMQAVADYIAGLR